MYQQVVQVQGRSPTDRPDSETYFRNHAKLYMYMPFEGYLPVVTVIPTLLVLLSMKTVSKGVISLRLSSAESLDGKRIHIPSPSQPRSRDFSPVEFDGHVVDPDGRTWKAGRMLDEHSESTRTPYSARELRPVVLFSGKTEGTCEIVFYADQAKEHGTYRKIGSSLIPRRARQTCPRDRIPPP